MRSSTACALLASLLTTPVWADNMQRGVDLPLYNGVPFTMTQLNASLAEFKADGGQYVDVNVWWFQDTLTSTVIAPSTANNDFSVPDSETISVIQAIQAAGLKAALKPIVDATTYTNGNWRGNIPGTHAWFTGTNNNGYTNFIDHYATIAAQNNVSLFCVGTELANTQSNTADWNSLITSVKATGYTGQLTYGANWGGGNSVLQAPVTWWNNLDYIGIDAYYSMPNGPNTTLAQLNAAWATQAGYINTWWHALPANEQKQILFTEVGYVNQDSTGATNLQLQANDYQALLSNLWGVEPWFQGVYWWDWTPSTPPKNYDSLILQGAPAEQVMAHYYTIPEPATAALAATGFVAMLLTRRRTKP